MKTLASVCFLRGLQELVPICWRGNNCSDVAPVCPFDTLMRKYGVLVIGGFNAIINEVVVRTVVWSSAPCCLFRADFQFFIVDWVWARWAVCWWIFFCACPVVIRVGFPFRYAAIFVCQVNCFFVFELAFAGFQLWPSCFAGQVHFNLVFIPGHHVRRFVYGFAAGGGKNRHDYQYQGFSCGVGHCLAVWALISGHKTEVVIVSVWVHCSSGLVQGRVEQSLRRWFSVVVHIWIVQAVLVFLSRRLLMSSPVLSRLHWTVWQESQLSAWRLIWKTTQSSS